MEGFLRDMNMVNDDDLCLCGCQGDGPLDTQVLDDPRFRAAVDEVFAAPGEFGPAKGYYGADTDHFIVMLRAALDRLDR